ncbi:MAG: OST-HTH/LOTUS domain-containing protein, partial [bacterium]
FTSTILQRNCHEFISFEVLSDDSKSEPKGQQQQQQQQQGQPQQQQGRRDRQRERRQPLELSQAMPLVERALQVLERREVTPQLGLLKSTMLQLDSAFSERAYGAGSFTDFVEKLRDAGFVNVSGDEGRYVIERKCEAAKAPVEPIHKPEEILTVLRDVLEEHRLELDTGRPAEDLEQWVKEAQPDFEPARYGFQEFAELLNYAQDKLVVRVEPTEDKGLIVYLGAEFYPPAPPEPSPEEIAAEHVETEEDEKQPETNVGPPLFNPEPPPKRKRTRKAATTKTTRKRTAKTAAATTKKRATRKRAPATE